MGGTFESLGGPQAGRGGERRRLATVAVVFLAALLLIFGEVWWAGPATHTPVERVPANVEVLMLMDHRYVTWVVARNARALMREPLSVFDAEACFPTEKSLALGEPALALGVLGVVPYALTADPELTYNVAFALSVLLGMVAMFVLVRDWSGSAFAGVVAALFYQFGRARMGDPIHPYVSDLSWGLLAMYFARRLFAERRWRDAFGLAACLALQLGASAYAQVSVLLIGLPFAAWLASAWRERGVPMVQLGFVALVAAASLAFTASPFLELRGSGALAARSEAMFAFPRFIAEALLVGSPWLNGIPRILLAAAGLVMPRYRVCAAMPAGLRPVLLLGAGLCLAASLGPQPAEWLGLPKEWNLWSGLSALLPPLAAVRVPAAVLMGVDLVVDVFAGFGVAAIVAAVPASASRLARVGLAVVLCVEVLGCWSRYRYRPFELQPEAEAIAFFDALARRGNDGPLFEWPDPPFEAVTADRLTLAGYHHRPTSACLASFRSLVAAELRQAGLALPARSAVETLARAGFTTLLVHHDAATWEARLRQFVPETNDPNGRLKLVHTTPERTAYAILPRP